MNKPLDRSFKRSRLWRLFGRDDGQGQIEFVLSILTIMFTIFWTWEVVLAVYTYNVLSDAAKEGVRYAIVHGSNNQYCSGPLAGSVNDGNGQCVNTGTAPQIPTPPSCGMSAALGTDTSAANVQSVVKCYAALSLQPSGSINGMTVTVGYPQGDNNALSQVNVTVHYQYVPFLALPITPTLNVASSGRIVN
ncbi:MAG TPA: TadE family protein [Terriglobia bacterium]|nr:TadE family protein [Terriglobia bacterium]